MSILSALSRADASCADADPISSQLVRRASKRKNLDTPSAARNGISVVESPFPAIVNVVCRFLCLGDRVVFRRKVMRAGKDKPAMKLVETGRAIKLERKGYLLARIKSVVDAHEAVALITYL